MIRKSLLADGLAQPKSISTVSSYVSKSAEKKRNIVRQTIKDEIEEGGRYAVALDEWTCPGKRARFLNICLHYMSKCTNLGLDYVNGPLPATEMKKMLIKKLKSFGISK